MRRTLLALPLLLAACGGWPAGSYVQSVSDADATVLAPAVADCVAAILPSRQDIRLEPAGAGDPIAPLLPPLLDRTGFTETPTGNSVSYVAGPMDEGVLLRVSVGDREGAGRYFARATNGVLTPGGPTAVTIP